MKSDNAKRRFRLLDAAVAAMFVLGLAVVVLPTCAEAGEWVSGLIWPEPKIIDPGPVGGPPSDAIVLFDGKDLSQFTGGENWILKDGYGICQGGVVTKQSFGDCQLHIEWASPEEVKDSSQGRGNSGVYMMGQYEIQILDSYDNVTYFDGQAGSIYKQSPPLVNACRKPGEWQTYDVIFKAPVFDDEKKLVKPAYVTLLHNGVLVQDHFEILGVTAWDAPPQYHAHDPKGPIHLQFHGNPVRFRNIWVREIAPLVPKTPDQAGDKAQAEPEKGQ